MAKIDEFRGKLKCVAKVPKKGFGKNLNIVKLQLGNNYNIIYFDLLDFTRVSIKPRKHSQPQ